ncbi:MULTISPECIES: tetratricopeptide repeat protein [unclassified Aureimonas]|uniref:tetratricopeptide repeat protein n=1 Tax=unclassified Aureimonas TaxID=2615206 RepID=UPI0006FD39C1|nr:MULTISPECIES: tetratricopeptide repeat protein [unclassified Aureimonas]KQT61271.1 hypothetical protein ASG54_24350 [Aureimonas sp. Leaf460]KQT68720.1 hypothetical protein ASG62_19110 [Aureimonas sp. Leaf427]
MPPVSSSTFQADRRAGLDDRRRGARGEALLRFRAAAEAHPGDRWNRNDIALELQALDRLDEAQAEAETLAAEAPDFAPAHRTLGLIARAKGETEAALGHFERAAACDPRDLWNRHDAAVSLRTLGRTEAAASAFLAVAEGTPLAHTLRALGEIAREAGRHDEALGLLQTAARLALGDPWFQLDLATAFERLGRHGEAETVHARLRDAHPGFLPAYRRAAENAARRGDPAAACGHLEAALALAPGDLGLKTSLAETLLKLGRLDEAETRFVETLMQAPGESAAYLGLARAARLRGLPDLAAAHLKAAEAVVSSDPLARLSLSAEWLALGEPARARSLYSRLDAAPAASLPHVAELTTLVRRAEGPAAARRLVERALALQPDHPRALLLLADDHRDRGLLSEADALYDRALAAKPDLYWAFVGKAAVARGLGRPGEATRHLEAAEAIDPVEGFARIERAADLRSAGRFDEALALLAALPPGSPRRAQAALARAQIARAQGDWNEASRLFEAAARAFPAETDALVEAAEDAFRSGEDARAKALLAEAAAAGPDRPARLEAEARRALIRDEPEAALALYRRSEASDPTRLFPALASARLEITLGRTEEGLAAFDRAAERFGGRPEIVLAKIEMQRQRGLGEMADALLSKGRRVFPHHAGLRLADIHALIEAGRHDEAEAALDALPTTTLAETGRVAFARSLSHAARFDLPAAIREGETAAHQLPGDGWVLNRLIHAALLHLDLDRAGRCLADLARLEASANRLRGKSANPSQSHYGQIFDEFRLDADALAQLQAARDLPDAEALTRAAEIVREHPGSTAAAIRFFIAQRRAGRLDAAPDAVSAETAIPASIHQYWNDPEPPRDLEPLIDSWRTAHPGFAHRLWDDTSARAFLESLPDRNILLAYDRAVEPAMKADLFRLALLARHGGLYADADDRCRRSLAPLLCAGYGLVLYQEDLGSLGNNLIATRPGHPIIERARDGAVEAVLRGDGDILWLSTGPGLLTRAAAAVLAETPAMLDETLILDRPALLAHVAIHCLAAYKVTERHWSRTAFGRARPAAKSA